MRGGITIRKRAIAIERFVAGLVGLGILSIGIVVLGFVWVTPGIPFRVRIFGSVVAIIFGIGAGGGTICAAIAGDGEDNRVDGSVNDDFDEDVFEYDVEGDEFVDDEFVEEFDPGTMFVERTASKSDNYSCDACGTLLASQADVSPHGDVKCSQCGRWFNIHGKKGPL